MRIDAHQHFWRLARGDYWWITPDKPAIHRDFGPEDLAPLLAGAGVERTVLVQCAPTEAETEFLLAAAGETSFVAGVVGWVDFDRPEAARRVDAMADRPGLVGLRPMIQDIADVDWMMSAHLGDSLKRMAEAGLVFDALVTPRHLPNLARFLDRHQDLTVVIDHGAKPDIAGGGLSAWADGMRRIAADTPAVCKLSGLATEAGPGWTIETLRPFVETLLESFGPGRLIWGSDWPVVNLNGSYQAWTLATETLLSPLSPSERGLILGGVAARIYGLGQ